MIQAAIFDMDGILIDSEPLWQQAEREIFSSVGVQVSSELAELTASMTTQEVTEFWYRHFPWSAKSLEQVENEVVDRVGELIIEKGQPMDGVYEILSLLHHRNIKIGLSTNSPYRLIPVVLQTLGIAYYFQCLSSSENEVQGKPHPAVYLTTSKKLNVEPFNCIAFEDSLSGLLSAQKANIKTVAVPSITEYSNAKYEIAQLKLSQLSDFTLAHLEQLGNAL